MFSFSFSQLQVSEKVFEARQSAVSKNYRVSPTATENNAEYFKGSHILKRYNNLDRFKVYAYSKKVLFRKETFSVS